jgi:hypothetical protein
MIENYFHAYFPEKLTSSVQAGTKYCLKACL